MTNILDNIVTDWDGFEKFVEEIHNDGDIKVTRDVTLTGKSEAPRQIDILLEHTKGPYEYKTLIECKFWNTKVKRQQIENMYASMEDLNASKGVFFTTVGYQSGAEKYAASKNIDIYVVRDLRSKEWGLPGRTIELYLQIFTKTVLNVACESTKASLPVGMDKPLDGNLKLNFGLDKKQKEIFTNIDIETGKEFQIEIYNNQIVSSHKKKAQTLEGYLELAMIHAIKEIQKKNFLLNSGEECTRYMQVDVNMPFSEKGEELILMSKGQLIYVPKIDLSVGIKVNQSKLNFDRSEPYLYALAVESCIENKAFIISKSKEDNFTKWQATKDEKVENNEDILQNDSIIKVISEGFFDASEMEGLEEKKINI